MSDLIFFEVDINHPCWFVETTEHNPEAQLKALQMVSLKGDSVAYLVELTSPNPKKDIEFIKKHELVKRVEVLMLKKDGALIKVSSSYSALTIDILHKTDVVMLESPITKKGVDKEILMTKNYKDLDRLIGRWKEEGWDVKLKKKRVLKEDQVDLKNLGTKGFFDLKSAKELITPKQLEVFKTACDHGYYERPKKITIEELALELGLSPSTVSEHLKKAEKKLMPILLKVLSKI